MLYCDECEQVISEGEEMNHVIECHPDICKDILSDWIGDNIYETDGSDPREEALTVGERNPTLR